MKKLVFLTFLFLVFNTSYSQFTKNSWEAGVLLNGGLVSNSSYSNQDDDAYFSINILPAYYIFNRFSIEPQFNASVTEGNEPEFNFIGNLSYTFGIRNSGFAPYFKAGYGISNAVSNNNYYSDKFDIGVFNSALGLKYLVNKKIALRGELNCIVYDMNMEDVLSVTEIDRSFSITQLSFLGGLSFLF
ncbi:MAG: outer membrane beta-barrel protein [Ignavibacteria bacterium]|nr:outer membrane beta-barrel protein [Ignavibacteria bacterium]